MLTKPPVPCDLSVLNVKAVVAAFNQEKALVGAFSVLTYEPSDGTFSSTSNHSPSYLASTPRDQAAGRGGLELLLVCRI